MVVYIQASHLILLLLVVPVSITYNIMSTFMAMGSLLTIETIETTTELQDFSTVNQDVSTSDNQGLLDDQVQLLRRRRRTQQKKCNLQAKN